MLTACGSSSVAPQIAIDPVIEARTIVEVQCPAELSLEIPKNVNVPDDAKLQANESWLNWFNDDRRRQDIIEQRLVDAKKVCEDE